MKAIKPAAALPEFMRKALPKTGEQGFFDRDFREMFSSQIVSLIAGLAVGLALVAFDDELLLVPGMLVLFPGFLEMRGNISGSFASRLSSGLFLGEIDPRKINSKIITGNLVASFFLALVVSLALGAVAFAFTYLLFGVVSYKILLLPVVAGLMANAIEIVLTLFATLWLFKKGHDPNNVMGPFVASTGDVTSVVSLLIALAVL